MDDKKDDKKDEKKDDTMSTTGAPKAATGAPAPATGGSPATGGKGGKGGHTWLDDKKDDTMSTTKSIERYCGDSDYWELITLGDLGVVLDDKKDDKKDEKKDDTMSTTGAPKAATGAPAPATGGSPATGGKGGKGGHTWLDDKKDDTKDDKKDDKKDAAAGSAGAVTAAELRTAEFCRCGRSLARGSGYVHARCCSHCNAGTHSGGCQRRENRRLRLEATRLESLWRSV